LIESCEIGIALTFDDGPWSYTPDLLDMLKERGHKATFFITGFNNGKSPIDTPGSAELQSVRRIHAEGHQIASHTWSHQRLTEVGSEIREQQVIYNEMALRNIFGFFPRYIRPPYGSCDSECLSYLGFLGYHVLGWSVDSEDWKNDTPDDIEKSKRIIDAAFANEYPPRLIILTHDTHYQTVYSLTSYILDRIEALGQKSITVGECLGESPEKWYHNTMATIDAGECIAGRLEPLDLRPRPTAIPL
jgi:peptidoglycan/xylan/chitin deacetylase (PgdA/CDA1 family)